MVETPSLDETRFLEGRATSGTSGCKAGCGGIVVDFIRPFGAKKVCDRQLHEEITNRSRIENACVKNDGKAAQF